MTVVAIYISGKTTCGLCHHSIDERDAVVACPPFVTNPRDKLVIFSDGVFHQACFEASPLSHEVQAILDKLTTMWKPQNRNCEVCMKQMNDPNDHFGTGYLSDTQPLATFNFRMVHKSCLSCWGETEALRKAIESTIASGEWGEAKALLSLRAELEQAVRA